MTPAQAEARKRRFVEGKVYRYKRDENTQKRIGTFFHIRGYYRGDIRCAKCGTWINENNPFESREIRYGTNGHKSHKSQYCVGPHSITPPSFATCSRDSIAKKRIEKNGIKRY